MLDLFQIVTSGGLVLFQKLFLPIEEMQKRRISISEFIQKKFLAQKLNTEEKKDTIAGNCYIYKFDKKRGLIYILVCPQEYYTPNFDKFFDKCVLTFEKCGFNLKEKEVNGCIMKPVPEFETLFNKIFESTNFSDYGENEENKEEGNEVEETKIKKKNKKKKKTKKTQLQKSDTANNSRSWDPLLMSKNNSSNNTNLGLNYSQIDDSDNEEYMKKMKNQFLDSDSEFSVIDTEDDTETNSSFLNLGSGSLFDKLRTSLNSLKEGKAINKEMLKPILEKFRIELIQKNVAEEIASKVVGNLETKLLEEKKTVFTSLEKIVRTALEESLREILTPKNHIDIVAEALKAKEEGRPYVVVFIGVNGVGKSTNLAKVAYLLKTTGFNVMLAACDNFRAGAVEQLKTHGTCLEIPVFDRGYKDDPANIAKYAIQEAAAKKIDVVLVDTAGRMQDNEPLMKALARLVHINNPDLVVFIGEALVGNDGIDQLTKFNSSLRDLSSGLVTSDRGNNSAFTRGREIDGVILSKFDTVDDKVGAALSMTYSTGKPILFVGIGQKYPHLKKLNIEAVIKSLLS